MNLYLFLFDLKTFQVCLFLPISLILHLSLFFHLILVSQVFHLGFLVLAVDLACSLQLVVLVLSLEMQMLRVLDFRGLVHF